MAYKPRSERLTREEYISRAYEFAHRTPKKLDAAKVKDIRYRASSGESRRLLASEYGVSYTAISKVVNYESWSS
jgi:hypothetical protein